MVRVYTRRAAAALGDLDGGDVGDLAVGAYGDGDGGSARGAVWVLFLDGVPIVCGNSVLDPLEECDDGGSADGDGCSVACEIEFGEVGIKTFTSFFRAQHELSEMSAAHRDVDPAHPAVQPGCPPLGGGDDS
jgi:cysteine-rich repeat protein